MSHDKGRTFKVIIETLEKLEYKVYTKVLDGKFYVPQHRERTLIVGMDNKIYGDKELFKFPEPPKTQKKIYTILEEKVADKYTLTDKLWIYLQKYAEKHRLKGNGFGFGMVDLNGISRTLSARYYKDGSEILIPQKGRNPRRLTPRECARLQGFPDGFKILVSDCQAYRQFGNSVVRPLMEAVAGKLVEAMGIKEKVKKYA